MIHFFTKGDRNTGSSRQRTFLVADELRARGWEAHVYQPGLEKISALDFGSRYLQVYKMLRYFFLQIHKYDIIFVHKGIYNKYFLILLILFKPFKKLKIVADFDDAVFVHSPKKSKLLLMMADVVFAGSHYILQWAQKSNNNVHLIPTCVPFDVYSRFTTRYETINDLPVIGWLGNGPAHYENLKHLPEIFVKLMAEGLKFKFKLVGSLHDAAVYEIFNIKNLLVEFIDDLDWSDPQNAAQEIQEFTVGIMPLENIEIEKGKCAFKAIEYMACGVPTIASNVGENAYLINNDKNGLLVDSWNDWPRQIKKLLDNPNLCQQLGKTGQETIKANYSFEKIIPRIEVILRNL